MAEKPEKPKKKKAKKAADKSVLGSLPSTRPERIGGARGETRPAPARSSTRASASRRPTAARRKAAAPRTFEPTEAAEAAAGEADERAAGITPAQPIPARPRPVPPADDAPAGPRAVRAGAPGIAPHDGRDRGAEPSGASLVGHVAHAAADVVRIGVGAGAALAKHALRRLRP